MNRIAIVLATVFGCGYFPIGPGTIGSAAGVVAALLMQHFGAGRLWLFVATAVICPVAVWSATETARLFGRKDPGHVVIDEVLGQWIAFLGAPVWTWKIALAAFFLFRVFDILKPPPVRAAESLPEGLGIVADDLLAGGYAALMLYIGTRLRVI